MSPCSGHGFKFGALMGLELARTIASERDSRRHARWAAGLEGDGADLTDVRSGRETTWHP